MSGDMKQVVRDLGPPAWDPKGPPLLCMTFEPIVDDALAAMTADRNRLAEENKELAEELGRHMAMESEAIDEAVEDAEWDVAERTADTLAGQVNDVLAEVEAECDRLREAVMEIAGACAKSLLPMTNMELSKQIVTICRAALTSSKKEIKEVRR